jgi:hypothetical protein
LTFKLALLLIFSVPEANQKKIEECTELCEKLEVQCEEEQKKYDKAVKVIHEETKEYQDQRDVFATKLIDLKKDVNQRESDLRLAENELNLINSGEQKVGS